MSARRRFDIAIEPIEGLTARRYSLHVAIYPTLAEMRRASRRHPTGRHPGAAELLADAAGCFDIATQVQCGRTVLGTMRLADEMLLPWVVIHEAVHAGVALAFSEHNHTGSPRYVHSLDLDPYLGGGWTDREELIAYGAHAFAFGIMSELGLTPKTEEATTP